MTNRRINAFIRAAYLLMIRRLHFAMGAIRVLRELEPRSRHHKPMTMHVGLVGQVGQGEAHYALAVIDSETRFASLIAAASYSNPIAVGVFLVGEAAISKSAVM